MSGESHSGLKFHVLAGVEAKIFWRSPQNGTVIPWQAPFGVKQNSEKVVNQIGQPYMECGTYNSC